jgi:hypothetical protein
MADSLAASQPDKITPLEKRIHKRGQGTGRPPGRPRTRVRRAPQPPTAETPVTDAPGIVQAPQVVKSEVDTVTEGLATLYGTLGTFAMFGNQYDGFVIINNSENMARSVVAACHPYPQAWKVLQRVVQGNVWSVLVLAHLGPALAIMANHGMVSRQVATAFRQAMPPDNAASQPVQDEGPYTYAGGQVPQQEMDAQQQQELAQYLAALSIQQGQQTAQQQAAMYAPPPVDFGNAGQNGAVGMDSISGLGDQDAAMARALFSASQIDKIRQESIRKTQEMQATGQANGL